jgi:hypothetical protein
MSLTADVKSMALKLGVDLVGIAPVDRFENAPEEGKPQFYMSEASGVVVLAIRVLKGLCETHGAYNEDGKTIGP